MGNKLSPLLANVFLSDFEVALGTEKLFPRVWRRYVYDIFAVVKERYLTQTLDLLNSRHSTIKFTVEKEIEGKLPFLDLMITRIADNKLKFGVYRKPTSTDRYITSDSNHFGAQKQAAFHSMAHHRQNATTLEQDKKQERRICLPFYHKITNPVQTALKQHGYQVAYKSGNTLKDLLCNLKDKVPTDQKSGIYQIPCKDCPAVYIGQTRRKFKVRIREHKHAVDHERGNDSSAAAYTIAHNHTIDWDSAKLVKTVRKAAHLNAWESMYIANAEHVLMNEDDAPISSPLFHLTNLKIQ
ncbi:uncharacterized protein LOC131688368 [Topomyia yanbarensis]|uniref:uncharacterized protein LOC131688368 n=1 Tax=Topomyia yanbarensis TaxID=2498891 RepID=UPI00273C0C95|nr:uncharacterized protein LOC131688368 [Topomyia yanbarensis]